MAVVAKAIERKVNNTPGAAKNVILFIGDGMGISTVTAARILEGQMQGKMGEEHQLSFEKFPFSGLAKTYNTNQQTPDSAGTMTAMMTGVKTKAGVIGVTEASLRSDFADFLAHGEPLVTALELAEVAGKATGIVSTTRITHATPAATYAKIPERDLTKEEMEALPPELREGSEMITEWLRGEDVAKNVDPELVAGAEAAIAMAIRGGDVTGDTLALLIGREFHQAAGEAKTPEEVSNIVRQLVNTASGVVTPIGLTVAGLDAIAWRAAPPNNLELYGAAHVGSGSPSTLYSLDPLTGTSSAIGSIGFNRVGGIDFHPSHSNHPV